MDSGSSVFQCVWAPAAVHRTVVVPEGKTGCLVCLDRSLWLVRLWLLPEVRGRWDSVVDTRGIRVDERSLVLDPLSWLSRWADVTVDAEALFFLICITILVMV